MPYQAVPGESRALPEVEPSRDHARRGVVLEYLLMGAAVALLLTAPEPSRAAAGSVKQTVAQALREPRASGNDAGLRETGCAIACPWPGAAIRK